MKQRLTQLERRQLDYTYGQYLETWDQVVEPSDHPGSEWGYYGMLFIPKLSQVDFEQKKQEYNMLTRRCHRAYDNRRFRAFKELCRATEAYEALLLF